MPEMPLDCARTWVDFLDPAEPAQRLHVDLTWLTSSYRCTFTSGCPGIFADRPSDGCCTLGAHFTDADDLARVGAAVARLTPADWQWASHAADGSGWTDLTDGEHTTRLIQGACVLLNRPGFPAGSGCALHLRAVADGIAPHTVKPDVCWQLPIRRSYRTVELPDETSYLEVTIGEYDRRGWGPGGHDLDWYCTRDPANHTAQEPLYLSCRRELEALIGPAAYEVLADHAAAYLEAARRLTGSSNAARSTRLLLHPATAAASEAPYRESAEPTEGAWQ